MLNANMQEYNTDDPGYQKLINKMHQVRVTCRGSESHRTQGNKLASLITLLLSTGCDHLSVGREISHRPRLLFVHNIPGQAKKYPSRAFMKRAWYSAGGMTVTSFPAFRPCFALYSRVLAKV